jgi:predicted dehydrogenase
MTHSDFSRRSFLRAAAGIGAAAVAAPATASALGAADKLRFALIGVGGNACGRGTDHLNHLMEMSRDPRWNLEVALVCDIYDKHLANALRLANRDRAETKCEGVKEWEKVVERKDIDCVVIAVPDHWHAPMALACMKAGKDVYLEKPMTLTIPQARDVYHTSEAEKRILQVGVQCTANGNVWGARALVEKGLLGKLLWSQTSYPRNGVDGEWNYPIQPDGSPTTILWDRFIGSAPKREYSGERFFRWRKYWDYSGGIATDLFYHRLAPLHLIFGPEFPRRAVAAGGIYVQKDGREVPDTLMITLEYPSGHYVILSSSMANDVGMPCIVRGHEATLFFAEGEDIEFDAQAEIRAQEPFRDAFKKAHDGKAKITVEPVKRDEHMENFIHCVRSRRAQDLNCPARLGYQTMVGIKMGVDAYRTQKPVEWDAEKEEVVG